MFTEGGQHIFWTCATAWPGLACPVQRVQSLRVQSRTSNNLQVYAVLYFGHAPFLLPVHLTNTWEMVVYGRIFKPLPPLVQGVERKSWLRLLGIIFQENPSDWDLHVDSLLCKASIFYAFVNILDILKSN